MHVQKDMFTWFATPMPSKNTIYLASYLIPLLKSETAINGQNLLLLEHTYLACAISLKGFMWFHGFNQISELQTAKFR